METQKKHKEKMQREEDTIEETIYERLSRIAAEAARNPSKIQKTESSDSKEKKPRKDLQHEKELSLHSYCNSVLEKQ